jgi:C-terminal processing protease CtpA/Prc
MIRAQCLALLLSVAAAAQGSAFALDASDRELVLQAVIEHLEHDYVYPDIGARAAAALQRDIAAGAYAELRSGEQFANALSLRIRQLTDDGHLNLELSDLSLEQTPTEEFSEAQMQRWYGAHINHGVESYQRLDGNIGYLDLRAFPPPDLGGDTLAAAMNLAANADALIIDLRNNGGGIGESVALVASYLFDSTQRPLSGVYDRPSDTFTHSQTQAYVPGRRFGGDKPVCVLISGDTFSAAEALAYDLQALQRATIVGAVSGGGAHPFEYLRIHPHFVLWSVTARSVNPITGTNWQYVGVKPDIEVPAEQALEHALEILRKRDANTEN